MIELFYAPTPNGWKISIMLEECGMPYRITPVFLNRTEKFRPDFDKLRPDFLKISPNGRIPAILDHDPTVGGEPVALFESAAILIYLADKAGSFIPTEAAARADAIAWLVWQVAHLGPTLGQHGHFLLYAPEPVPYAIDRFRQEALRLYGVLDRRLADTGYVTGAEYGIADMACFPWIMMHKAQRIPIDEFPHVKRWFAELRARELLQRGVAAGRELFAEQLLGGESRRPAHGDGPTKPEG